jgi:hypothetical protein
MECFYSGKERILLNDVIQKLKNNALVKVDTLNMSDFVEQGNRHNSNGHKEGEHHHRNHNHH